MCSKGHFGAAVVKVDAGHGILWIPGSMGVLAKFYRPRGKEILKSSLPKHLSELADKYSERFYVEPGWYFGDNTNYPEIAIIARGARADSDAFEKLLKAAGLRIDVCEDHVVPFTHRYPDSDLQFDHDLPFIVQEFPTIQDLLLIIKFRKSAKNQKEAS